VSYAWNSYGFLPNDAPALTLITVPHPALGEQSFRLPYSKSRPRRQAFRFLEA